MQACKQSLQMRATWGSSCWTSSAVRRMTSMFLCCWRDCGTKAAEDVVVSPPPKPSSSPPPPPCLALCRLFSAIIASYTSVSHLFSTLFEICCFETLLPPPPLDGVAMVKEIVLLYVLLFLLLLLSLQGPQMKTLKESFTRDFQELPLHLFLWFHPSNSHLQQALWAFQTH